MDERTPERAVVDRFEGSYAVLLIGDARRPLDVPREHLPPQIRAGTWLLVELVQDQVRAAQIDGDATQAARRRIAEKHERLRRGDHLNDEH